MADVAKLAGVAPITVSRVINNHPLVTDATRAKVQQAIDTLGYRSNMAARTLAGGRSRVLGVISVESEFYGPSRALFGIHAAARQFDHSIVFVTLREASVDEMRAGLDHLRDAHAEGVIVIAPVHEAVDALRSHPPDRAVRRHLRHQRCLSGRQHRSGQGCTARHRSPAGPRPRDGPPPPGSQGMARRRGQSGRMETGTALPQTSHSSPAPRGLEPRLGVPRRGDTRR